MVEKKFHYTITFYTLMHRELNSFLLNRPGWSKKNWSCFQNVDAGKLLAAFLGNCQTCLGLSEIHAVHIFDKKRHKVRYGRFKFTMK